MPGGPSGFFAGAFSVLRGAGQILGDSELRRLAAVPLFLTAILYLVLITLALFFADDLLARIWPQPEDGFLHYLWYVLLPFVFVAMLAPFALLFSTIAEAIGGSFYDKMAVKVLARHAIYAREPGLVEGTLPDIARSLALTFAGAACTLLAFIPAIGVVFGALGLLIAWLGFASAAINSALMATGLGLRARISFIFSSFFAMAGIGAVVSAALLVPFAGLVALPAAVVGSTDLYARSMKRS